jgi:hypothetical protein
VWLERTAKSCGPDVAVLALSPREAKLLGGDGGKRAVHRGEREVSRKATAQGRPGCSACTCMLVCAFLVRNCTRDRGCSVHPVFPAPSILREGQRTMQNSGERCRENAKPYPRHCERSDAIHLAACRAMDCFASPAITVISRSVMDLPVGAGNNGRYLAYVARPHNPSLQQQFQIQCVPCKIVAKSRTIRWSENESIQNANDRGHSPIIFCYPLRSKR